MSRARQSLVAATIATACSLCSCRQPTPAQQAANQGLLLLGNPGEPACLDPQLASNWPAKRVFSALFEGLATPSPQDPAIPCPGIAERWESNANSTEWTFHLRRNAEWSDGAPVTALDVVFAFHRMLHPDFAAPDAGALHPILRAREYSQNRRGFLLCGNDPDFPVPWPRLQHVNFSGHQGQEPESAADFADLTESMRRKKVAAKGLDRLDARELAWIAAQPNQRFDWPADVPDEARREVLRRLIACAGQDLWSQARVGIEAVDDFTLRFRLSEPRPDLPALACQQAWLPVPRHVVLQHGKLADRFTAWSTPAHFVGNGPFRLKSWRPLDAIEVETNPGHHLAPNLKLRAIRFLAFDNPYTETRAFLAGQLHATSPLPPDLLPTFHQRQIDSLREDSGLHHMLVDPCLRNWQPLFRDQPAWQAVAFAP